MKNVSSWMTVLGVVAGAVLVGVAIAWYAGRAPSGTHPVVPQPPLESHASLPTPNPLDLTNRPAIANPGGVIPPTHSTAVVPSTDSTNTWEDKLEEILVSETDDTNKLKQLFEMFPHLPEDGQVEVAQHLSNLVEDQNYAPLGKLLDDAKLPEDVLDVLMADLLNRPNAVKLPMFLEIAKTPDHAKAEESKDLLQLYLDEDYGNDWPKWQDALKSWMEKNPD